MSSDLAYEHLEVVPLPHAAQVDWFAWMDFFRTAAAVIVVISHARDVIMADYNGQLLYAPIYAATGFGPFGCGDLFCVERVLDQPLGARSDRYRAFLARVFDRPPVATADRAGSGASAGRSARLDRRDGTGPAAVWRGERLAQHNRSGNRSTNAASLVR